jgi:Ni,Fe-hydrogenase I cytochrome b subunit
MNLVYQWHDITHFILSVLYSLLGLLSILWIIRLCLAHHFKRWQLIFHPIFLLGTAARAAFFFLQPFIIENSIQLPSGVNFMLNSLPSWFFFTDYLIILFLWVDIYHSTRTKEPAKNGLNPLFWFLNAAMWASVSVLYFLDILVMEKKNSLNPLEETLVILGATVYILTSLAFLIYGTSIYMRLAHQVTTSVYGQVLLWKIQIMTTMVSVVFFCRATIMLLVAFVFPSFTTYWWFGIAYYLSLEWFPLLVMLGILHIVSTQRKYTMSSISAARLNYNAIINSSPADVYEGNKKGNQIG